MIFKCSEGTEKIKSIILIRMSSQKWQVFSSLCYVVVQMSKSMQVHVIPAMSCVYVNVISCLQLVFVVSAWAEQPLHWVSSAQHWGCYCRLQNSRELPLHCPSCPGRGPVMMEHLVSVATPQPCKNCSSLFLKCNHRITEL